MREGIGLNQAKEVLRILEKTGDWKDYCFDLGGRLIARVITIQHSDGSRLMFQSAMCRRVNDWIFVLTEHHGSFMYHETDIDWVREEMVPMTLYKDVSGHHYGDYEWDEKLEDDEREEVISFEDFMLENSLK